MLGGTSLSAVLGAGPDPASREAMRGYVRALCNAGCAALFVAPRSKEPVDLRTAQKRAADDRAARSHATAAGRPGADRVRSPAGLHLATTDPVVALRYLDRYFELFGEPGSPPSVNLAVEVGRSGLVVVDCDTAAQVQEFLAMFGAPFDLPPTVSTPGKQNPDGTWSHRDGGHFYFTVPQGSDAGDWPTGPGSLSLGDTGFTVLWRNRYVLIPPSTRDEGAYVLTGREYELPEPLREVITARLSRRAQQAARRRDTGLDATLGDRLERWAAEVSWESILAPLGWVPVARPDSCGCMMLTAPGDHASLKSATAHDAGCSLDWSSALNAPLHLWTDNPGQPWAGWVAQRGTSTLTKLQAWALTRFDGDMATAMTELGLRPEQVTVEPGISARNIDASTAAQDQTSAANLDRDIPEPEPEPQPQTAAATPPPQDPPPTDPPLANDDHDDNSSDDASENDWPNAHAVDPTTGLYIPENPGVPVMAPFDHWRDLPPPEFVVAGLFEHGGLSALVGSAGAGKTTLAVDLACHVTTGRSWQGRAVLKTRVLYLAGEGLPGVSARVNAWCAARNLDTVDLVLGKGVIPLGATPEAWAELREYVAAQQIGLLIFDTFARTALNLEENSATDMSKAIKRFDQVREMTNAGVLVIHHTTKYDPTIARGSSALGAALDSEVCLVAEERRIPNPAGGEDSWARPVRLLMQKQRNAEREDEPIELLMTDWQRRAPLITGPTGSIDPMQGEILLARPTPEPIVETAIRVAEFVARFTEQGATRTEIVAGVSADPYTARMPRAAVHWRLKVGEAVDRGLRYGLLETLTGRPTGTRYVRAEAITPGMARQAASDEVLNADTFNGQGDS